MSDEIILYEHPLSPYAQKVKLGLLEKGLDFEVKHFGSLTEAERQTFHSHSPRGEIPLMLHNRQPIFDSGVILAYIEEQWPQPSLLPESPAARAQARMLQVVVDTHFEANTWGLSEVKFFQRAEGELANRLNQYGASQIGTWLAWLDKQLAGRPWFNGAQFGWADICVVPFVNGATRYNLYPQPGTALAGWLVRANARESVAICKRQADAAELDAQVMTAAIASGFKREYRDHRLEWMIRAGGLEIVAEGLDKDNIRFNPAFL